MGTWNQNLKTWAQKARRDIVALWIAARDSRTPLAAKLVAATIAAYALSPIDIVPDFIPVLGYLDDVLLLPLGIMLAVRLIPPALMTEFRATAQAREGCPYSRAGLLVILALWIGVIVIFGGWLVTHAPR